MIKRLLIYLNEMFPLTSFVGTLLTGFSLQLIYLRLFGIAAQFHYQMILSGIVITSVTLLIRVMDEFKDFEDDKKNFPLRPLPSGRVYQSDLKILAGICVATIIFLSLGSKSLFLFALCTLVYSLLMLKWFFIEKRMRQSLPLAFISHHPIVIFNVIYLVIGMLAVFPELNLSKLGIILPICLIFTNWEFARKIRMPQEETDYTTYSKIWGPRAAISISIILQVIYLSTVFYIFSEIGSPLYLRIGFGVLIPLMMLPSLKFLHNLQLKAPLKTNAENQVLLVIGFLVAAAFL